MEAIKKLKHDHTFFFIFNRTCPKCEAIRIVNQFGDDEEMLRFFIRTSATLPPMLKFKLLIELEG